MHSMQQILKWLDRHKATLVVVFLHVLAWVLYLSFYNLGFLNNRFSLQFRVWYLVSVALLDGLIFYYFYFSGIPKLLVNKKSGLFVIVIVLILVVYPLISYGVNNLLTTFYPNDITPLSNVSKERFWTVYGIRALSCLFVIAMAGIGKFTFDWFKNLRIKRELETQNLTSELAFLKSQINPHFLFNTLNNIHTLAYKKADGAPEAIMKLSELMRYMIYESNVDVVPLTQEIEYLKSFIDLQELRFKTKGIVDFEISGEIEEAQIAPLILLPFVENAFKHGYQIDSQGAIKVRLLIGEQIEYSVANGFSASHSNEQRDEVGGIGLENIQRRLELIYPKQFELSIDQSEDHFKVKLIIKKA